MRSTVPLGVSPDRSTRARWTLPLLLLAVLGLVVPGLVAPATAYAADDPGIKVEVTRLVSTDSDGVAESDNQLTKWYTAKLVGTWDATSLPAITAGTSFTVGLPDVFTFRQYPRTDPMTVRDEGGVERTVGECVTTKSEMTCTFNEEAARLSAAGFKNFKGGFSLMLTAVNTTDQETAKFNLNGQVRDIDLPGTGGIAPELFKPAALTKWTQEVIKVGQTENLWVVYWGNNYLRDGVKPEGTIKTDGSVSTLEIHETLAPGQEFNWDRPADVRLAFNQSAADSGLFQVVWTMDGSTQHPDWSVEVIKNSPSDVTFKVTGPFPADTNMSLFLPVKFTEPAKPGVKYSNTVAIEGLASSSTVSAYYVDSVEITVTMEPGYGTFKVSKLVEGDGAALLDSNVQFPLQVDFTLPAHYNTYNPVWQPPAGFTMDADGLNGHGTIMIAPGKTTYFDPQVTLPAGTTVTLSEDPNGAQPAAPSTVQWGAPEFSQNSFVIGDQRTTAVQVTNKTTYVPAPPAVSVGDYVWEDVNRDGLQDDTDKPIENVELAISRTDGAQVNNADGTPRGALTTTTDASGKYVFDNLEVLPAGTHYVVSVNAGTVPAGLLATTDNAGDRDKDSSAQAGKAESTDLTTDGASDMTLDFGYVRPAVSVGDYVWEDVNKDGLQDDTDKPIEGVTLTISRSDGAPVNNSDGSARAELTTKTDEHGQYVFGNLEVLPAGTHYVVTVTAPEGYQPTKDGAGDRDKDSSAQAGKAESVDLTTDGASDMTLDFGYVRAAVSVGDYVWEDVNKDGLQDDTDKPIEGVTLTISRSDGAPVNNPDGTPRAELTTKTDASGKYVFDNLQVLPAGVHYVVTVTAPEGYQPTKDGAGDRDKDSSAQAGSAESVDLTTDGASDMTLDFGYVRPAVSVGDYVWWDVNKDGVQDDTDKPIEGVTLTISRSDGAPVNNPDGSARAELTTKTDASGKYVFDNLQALPAGVHYVVTVTAPEGYQPTKDGAADRDKDSSAQAGSAESVDLTTDGASDMTLDFGYVAAVSVGDYVWEDVNKDGVQDDTDKPIEGVTLTISRSDGAPVNNSDGSARAELTTKTDASGKYVFDNLEVLPAGTHYVVTVTAPDGFEATKDSAGDRDKDSSAQAGKAESVDLTTNGASDMTLDFGYVRPAVSVGDYVWHDVDRNGVQDDTDKPIEGVTLTISRSDGAPVNNPDGTPRAELTTKTDASGKYVFDNLQALPAGVHYVVTVTAPEGFLPTKDGAADRDKDSSAQAGSVESVDLTTDGASDMTLDFGYVRPAVFVGDYVWEDVNKDGLQDDTDKPIQGVTLTISRSDGAPVNNADGSARTELTTQTGPDGKYVFELLEVLPAGVHYVVTVTAPEGFLPTVDNAGDRAVDSSAKAGMAESVDLTDDGASDMTLDFGYVRPEPPVTATPSPKPGKPLAKTGASILVPLMLAGAALGGGSLLVARRRRNG